MLVCREEGGGMGAVLPRPATPSSMTLLRPVLGAGSFIPVRLLMLELKCEGKVEHCLPGGDIRGVTVSQCCSVSPCLHGGGWEECWLLTQHPSAVLSLHPAPVRTKVGPGGQEETALHTTTDCQRQHINKLHSPPSPSSPPPSSQFLRHTSWAHRASPPYHCLPLPGGCRRVVGGGGWWWVVVGPLPHTLCTALPTIPHPPSQYWLACL